MYLIDLDIFLSNIEVFLKFQVVYRENVSTKTDIQTISIWKS